MIYDSFDNAGLYVCTHPKLRKGLDFLRGLQGEKAASLPDGRHEIEGSDVFALLSSYDTEPEEARRFEAHRTYLDIQCVLSGNELIYWADVGALEPDGGYSEEKDIIFFQGSSSTALHLRPGYFAVYFARDAHKPCCSLKAAEPVRKALVKIALSP